jgi:hypothetical protein
MPRLHGFDSFIGIPEKWNSLEVATFTMDGKIPEIIRNVENIQVHKGWFNETKFDLDHYPVVGFLHIDVDLYSSAREVMLHYGCRFVPGTILVFDELINYSNWENDGEFKALQEVAALIGFTYTPLEVYFEQAVPIAIVENKRIGCGEQR